MIVCAAVVGQAVKPQLLRLSSALDVSKHVPMQKKYLSLIAATRQNNPLYLETFQQGSSDDALRFHYIVHCSLDAVEEKRAPSWPAFKAVE